MEFRKSRFSKSREAKTHGLPLVDSRPPEIFTAEDENLFDSRAPHFRTVWEVTLKAIVILFYLQEDCKCVTFKFTILNVYTYKQFAFIKVLASATGIFHFFTKY